MSTSDGFEGFAPLVLAGVVVLYLAIAQPLSTEFVGISMNLVAAVIVTVGGVLGAFQ